jgi:hypothetical protein
MFEKNVANGYCKVDLGIAMLHMLHKLHVASV